MKEHLSPPVSPSVSQCSHPLCWSQTKGCTLCIQMQHWSFICWVLQRSPYNRGSVYGRQRADWFDLGFSLPLHCQMIIPFSVTDLGMCAVLSIRGSTKQWPWLRQTEVDRLYPTICHRPEEGRKRQVWGDRGMHFDGVPVKQTTRRGMSGIGCHMELTYSDELSG